MKEPKLWTIPILEMSAELKEVLDGVYDNQTPLDAWTKLAHALFQSNEAMFYN